MATSVTFPQKTLLELYIQTEPENGDSRSRFRALAREEGLDFHPIRLPGLKAGDSAPQQYFEQIRSAHGYWVRWPGLLAHDAFARDSVMGRVRAGDAWMILHADPNYLGETNSILREFGIVATDVKVFRREGTAHPSIIDVDREVDATAFRDSYLFNGVTKLKLGAVRGLECRGDSQSVLAIPDRGIALVDAGDLFTSWPSAEVPCIGIWRSSKGKGGLVVVSGTFYRDPYTGPLGDDFPEIAGADNERLCANLLQLIADIPRVRRGWDEAASRIRQLESNLFFITKHTLVARFGEAWWSSGVQERIRTKCRERRERENGAFGEPAYLELLDYKKIWKDNWNLFGPILDRQGIDVSKRDAAIGFFERIHPVRLMVAHATKTAASGQHAPNGAQWDAVVECSQLAIQIYRREVELHSIGS